MIKEKKSESIKFRAQAVIYEADDSGFKIIKGKAYDKNGVDEIGKCSLKGELHDVEEGDEVFAVGYWDEHPKYGVSFYTTTYVKSMQKTPKSILNYLKNGNIAGISQKKAELIVDKFGSNTFDVLVYQTHLLKEINGIGKKTIEKIKASAKECLEQQSIMESILMYIQSFDISPAYAKRIYNRYGEKSMAVIKENPYKLADEVKGIGFLKADEIALKNGVQKDSPFRVESAVLYVITQMSDEGDVYGEMSAVSAKCCEFLGLGYEYVDSAIKRLVKDKRLINDNGDLYIPKLYYAEVNAAEKLMRLTMNSQNSFNASDYDIESMSKAINIKYEDAQVRAIKTACKSNVCVITGGPGTGKTTVINGIIRLCRKRGLKVACAAPTGKASKRMSEATGMEAKTIHKLLEMKYDEENKIMSFSRNEDKPLDEDVLIIDESSMVDILLFNSLMRAVPLSMKVIMVGDVDQLPSVGCGNVLNDVISSDVVPVETLSIIHRQTEGSDIIKNAHKINTGHTPELINKRTGDFFFINTDGMEPEAVRDLIVRYVSEGLPRCYHVSPDEIQVLAPMKKGHTGVYELNNFIQEKVNPYKKNKPSIMTNGNIFREGDKVMCTSNDYSNNVFNGDVGIIKTIKAKIDDFDDDADDKKKETYFSVDFGDREVFFPLKSIDNFTLSYAMTIHKSQGSEYDIVVMPLLNQNYVMLQRNLLYTGLTRAKKVFVLVGQRTAVRTAVHTLKVIKRNTHLADRLKDETGIFGITQITAS